VYRAASAPSAIWAATAKIFDLLTAMGLNAVQTLIPWMMMEPHPDEFVTSGFMDIVRVTPVFRVHASRLPFILLTTIALF
jgi:hypothetical protein